MEEGNEAGFAAVVHVIAKGIECTGLRTTVGTMFFCAIVAAEVDLSIIIVDLIVNDFDDLTFEHGYSEFVFSIGGVFEECASVADIAELLALTGVFTSHELYPIDCFFC